MVDSPLMVCPLSALPKATFRGIGDRAMGRLFCEAGLSESFECRVPAVYWLSGQVGDVYVCSMHLAENLEAMMFEAMGAGFKTGVTVDRVGRV